MRSNYIAGTLSAGALALVMFVPMAAAREHGGGGAGGMHASTSFRGGPALHGDQVMNFKGGHDHDDHHGHGHHHHRVFFGIGPYDYDAGVYFSGGCEYYRHKAHATGLRYWWRLYRECQES